MRSRLSQMVLTIAAAMLLAGWSTLALAKDDKFRARQHGNEHGYRDGYHHGREDRERHAKYDFKSDDYKEGDRGYGKYMGDEDEYKKGYRSGYETGYGDAYYSRQGRFAEIYGREDDLESRRDRDRDVTILEVRPEGYPDIAYDNGYRDGIRAGQKDLRNREDFDPADQSDYRDGDRGYRSSYGEKEVYKRYYREGFMRGYQDGYGRWRAAGDR